MPVSISFCFAVPAPHSGTGTQSFTRGGQVLYQVNYIPAQAFEFLFIEALEEDGNRPSVLKDHK